MAMKKSNRQEISGTVISSDTNHAGQVRSETLNTIVSKSLFQQEEARNDALLKWIMFGINLRFVLTYIAMLVLQRHCRLNNSPITRVTFAPTAKPSVVPSHAPSVRPVLQQKIKKHLA
eukprot:6782431-Ditylum_brightwellii.AAC.1